MGSIVLLDEHTVNKIAAGEVVDRPASIVKELVENSIDAGASSVTIEIKNGGISYIKIVDNGIGFYSDDIEMAFERHATSKIRKEEDLLKITSMGFRGEALASIAAISKVTLTTKSKDEEIGTKAVVAGGKIESLEQCAAVQGTKIEIRDVFYNVPARFKFLKKDYTEAGYIEDVVIRLGLSYPNVSFKYVNNGKVILQTSGKGDLKSAIYDIFGKEIYQNVIPLYIEHDGIIVEGMVGLPIISRSTRMYQFTFVNNRYIKDKTISSSIDKACAEKYAINKFPFIVLNLKINPSHIDVNVHPAKLEIKFENEAQVFQAIYIAIKNSLEKKQSEDNPFALIRKEEVVERVENAPQKQEDVSKIVESNNVKKFNFEFAEPQEIYKKDIEVNKIENQINQDVIEVNIDDVNNTFNINEKKEDVENITQNTYVTNIQEENKKEEVEEQVKEQIKFDDTNTSNANEESNNIYYKYVGQVFDTYIIIQIGEKMYIIDQHAAHERLLYEKIKNDYYSKDRQCQMLLIPVLIELTKKEMDIICQNREMFEKAGFVIEDFGDNSIKISGVPNIGYEIDYKSMLKDIIDELLGASKTEKSEKEFRFLATLACKAAVKGNMKLDKMEQISLIDDMVKLDRPFTCPHGRPTAYEITKYEIERKFLRK